MRSKFVEHPIKLFAINLQAQVLIRTNPCKLELIIISLRLLIMHSAIHDSGNIIDGSLIYNILNGAHHTNQ